MPFMISSKLLPVLTAVAVGLLPITLLGAAIPPLRRSIVQFARFKPLFRALLHPLGAAIYPILIAHYLRVGDSEMTTVLWVAFVIYILGAFALNIRCSEDVTQILTEQRKKTEDLQAQYDVLKRTHKFEKYIELLIEKKSQRFFKVYKELKAKRGNSVSGDTIFNQITQPTTQLTELYTLMSQVFQAAFCEPDDEIGYSVMEPREGRLRFVAYNPRPSSIDWVEYTEQGDAFKKNSGFSSSTAWETERLVIIEDIAQELKKPLAQRQYQLTKKQDHCTDGGSLIAYPVFDKENQDEFPDGLICVITITSRRSGTFKLAEMPLYMELLNGFGCRIILEKRLWLLKNLIGEGVKNA